MLPILEKYIMFCINTPEPMNKYARNEHLAEIFCGVYEVAEYDENGELQDMVKNSIHDDIPEVLQDVNGFRNLVLELFVDVELTPEIVHNVYQELRGKTNVIRNLLILIMIIYDDGTLMRKRQERGAHEIFKEFKGNKL